MISQVLLVYLTLYIYPIAASSPVDALIPRQAGGTLPECRLNYTTSVWTGCEDVLAQFSLTLDQFIEANPGIGDGCANFVPGKVYCVSRFVKNNTTISDDGNCGAAIKFAKSCVGSKFGECCGADGKCGSGEQFCGIGNCQEGACLGGGPYSTDGRCGRSVDFVPCPPKFGLCCSKDGKCGNDTLSCGSGCQGGPCSGTLTTTTSTTTMPTPTLPPGSVTEDGACGYKRKWICGGSKFGKCCSAAGYCGSSQYHCSKLLGCQPDFGTCS